MSTISKTSTFEIFWDAQNFFKVFLPVRSTGFCLLLGLGPLPRQSTTALRSPDWPRLRGWAAPRGQGGRGCEGERQWPFPQTKIWGGNLLRHGIVRTWMKCWSVDGLSVLVEIVFAKFWWCTRKNRWCSFCSCDWFVSYTSMGCWEIGLWSGTLFYLRFQLANRLHAHHNPRIVPSVLRVSTLMTLI